MADALDLLRAALNAPGTGLTDDEIEAMEAKLAVLEQLGEGTLEWGVRYEYLKDGEWIARARRELRRHAEADAAGMRNVPDRYRNVEIISRRRYVTDWQPVEPQP